MSSGDLSTGLILGNPSLADFASASAVRAVGPQAAPPEAPATRRRARVKDRDEASQSDENGGEEDFADQSLASGTDDIDLPAHQLDHLA
jgi:hypothetical protein